MSGDATGGFDRLVATPAPYRRRRLLAVAVACLLLAGIAGLVLRSPSGGGAGEAEVPLPLPPAPVADPAILTTTAAGSDATAGIEVTIEAAGEVVVGTRTSAEVTVRNLGATTLYWQAGECGIPATILLARRDAALNPNVAASPAPRVSSGAQWDGTDGTLDDALADADPVGAAQLAVPPEFAGFGNVGCPAVSLMESFPPGGVLEATGTFEVRMPPGPLPDGGALDVVAAFTAFAAPEDWSQFPLPPVVARVPITVVDDPARLAASVDEIADAVTADGRAEAWYATTLIPGRPDLDQRALVGVTWWRRAWEVWVSPVFGGGGQARIRVDPQPLEVVDARVVPDGAAPEDEPGIVRFEGLPPDELLPLPGAGAPPAGATAEPSTARVGDAVTITATGGAGDVCAGLVVVYESTGDGLREVGATIGDPSGAGTWNTAPPGLPITLPPCQPDPALTTVTFTVPDLPPGSYSVCLTRVSGRCADLEVVP